MRRSKPSSISSVHWSDGALIDVDKVGAALRQRGAFFLIDATQAVGVLAMDVKRSPDFVMFPTYKWVHGPYGRAFLYVAKRHQGGIPLEQISAGCRNVRAENACDFTDLDYAPDACRFDMGERDYFISMEMAAIGMEMLAEWARLPLRADKDADGADCRGGSGIGVSVSEARPRARHTLSLKFQDGCWRDWSRDLQARVSMSRRDWAHADPAACLQ